jgi:hypothetical protein
MTKGCGMRRAVFFMSRCEAYRDIKNTVAGERRTNAAQWYKAHSPKPP